MRIQEIGNITDWVKDTMQYPDGGYVHCYLEQDSVLKSRLLKSNLLESILEP